MWLDGYVSMCMCVAHMLHIYVSMCVKGLSVYASMCMYVACIYKHVYGASVHM